MVNLNNDELERTMKLKTKEQCLEVIARGLYAKQSDIVRAFNQSPGLNRLRKMSDEELRRIIPRLQEPLNHCTVQQLRILARCFLTKKMETGLTNAYILSTNRLKKLAHGKRHRYGFQAFPGDEEDETEVQFVIVYNEDIELQYIIAIDTEDKKQWIYEKEEVGEHEYELLHEIRII